MVFFACGILALNLVSLLQPDEKTPEKQIPGMITISEPLPRTGITVKQQNISEDFNNSFMETREINRSALVDPVLVFQHLQRDDGSDVIAVYNRSVQIRERILRSPHNSEHHAKLGISIKSVLESRHEISLDSSERSDMVYLDFDPGARDTILP